jgi:hypothetical protein
MPTRYYTPEQMKKLLRVQKEASLDKTIKNENGKRVAISKDVKQRRPLTNKEKLDKLRKAQEWTHQQRLKSKRTKP